MIDTRFRLKVPIWTFFPLAAALFAGQEKSVPPAAFPQELLAGNSDFEFAILLQGDARGNVGPCG